MSLSFGPEKLSLYARSAADVSVRADDGDVASLSSPITVDAQGRISFTVTEAGYYTLSVRNGSTVVSKRLLLEVDTPQLSWTRAPGGQWVGSRRVPL